MSGSGSSATVIRKLITAEKPYQTTSSMNIVCQSREEPQIQLQLYKI